MGTPASTRLADRSEDATAAALLIGSAISLYAIPWTVPSILLLFVVGALIYWRLDLGLYLPVLFAPAFMLPKHFGTQEFAPSEIFILLDVAAAALWLLSPARRRAFAWDRLRRSPFVKPAILLLAAGALSTLGAADRHVALRGYREWLLEPAVWFGLLCILETKLRNWILGAGALVAAGSAMALLAIVQLIAHHNTGSAVVASIPRVMALYGSPDNLGLLLDRVIPIWFAALLFVRWRGRQILAALAVGALLVFALGFTFSRGAWIGMLVACIALSLRYRWGRAAAVLCAVIAIGAIAWKGPSVVRALQTGHANTAERRLYVWKSAARLIRDHPILGVGPDNFIHYYAPGNDKFLKGCSLGLGYMDQAAADEPCLSHPHNEFLDFWLSTGIAGLAAFLWLLIAFWRSALAELSGAEGHARILLLGAMGAMIASLIHGFVDNFYFLPDLSIFFWLLCGMVSFVALTTPSGSGTLVAGAGEP